MGEKHFTSGFCSQYQLSLEGDEFLVQGLIFYALMCFFRGAIHSFQSCELEDKNSKARWRLIPDLPDQTYPQRRQKLINFPTHHYLDPLSTVEKKHYLQVLSTCHPNTATAVVFQPLKTTRSLPQLNFSNIYVYIVVYPCCQDESL